MCSMQGTRDLFAIARLDLLQREHHEISAEKQGYCSLQMTWGATILMIFIPVWQSARKKWRYDFKPTTEVPV